MKNFIFISLLFFSLSSFSQKGSLMVGLAGGVNHSFIWGNNYRENLININPVFEGVFSYGLSNHVGIKSGLSYQKKGRKSLALFMDDRGNPVGDVNTKSLSTYLVLPLLLNFHFGSKVEFVLDFGIYYGLFLKGEYLYEDTSFMSFSSQNNTYEFKKSDVGSVLGLGMKINATEKISFFTTIRNDLGLMNVSKTKVYNNGAIRNNSTLALLGLAYKFK